VKIVGEVVGRKDQLHTACLTLSHNHTIDTYTSHTATTKCHKQ